MGQLYFDPDAFSGLGKSESKRLLKKIEWLWDNRRIVIHHPLRHDLSGFFKRVVGKYRVVYSYDDDSDDMVIRLVGTCDTIYQVAIRKLRQN